jgi:hypothetical protein
VTTHNFEKCMSLGKVGEQIAVAALSKRMDWSVDATCSTRRDQSVLGCDYVVRRGVHRGGLEVKTDMRAWDTGRIAFEIEHEFDNGQRKEGWAYLTAARYLAVIIAPRDAIAAVASRKMEAVARFEGARMHVIDVGAMRESLNRWRQRYPPRPAPNDGYKTWNLCIPEADVVASEMTVADYVVWFRLMAVSGPIMAEASDAPKQRVIA